MSADDLVRAHADLAFRVALRVVGSEADAADVAQIALVKVWRRGLEVPADRRQAWVARVARNAALDWLRALKARPRPSALDDPPDARCPDPLPDADSEASDLRRELSRAIEALDEPYRSIVVLREIEGLAYSEVADALDLPLNTLKVYLHRARKRLRAVLESTVPDLVP